MGFFEEVYKRVKMIPKGKVANYGQSARLAGNSTMARQVGWALHVNPYPGQIPCHRVVTKDGCLTKGFAFGGIEVQKQMLVDEGVFVDDNFVVDMTKYKWDTEDSYEKRF